MVDWRTRSQRFQLSMTSRIDKRSLWSDEVLVMLRPTRIYSERASHINEYALSSLFQKWLFVSLVIGAFVSLTASGRLTALLLLDGALFWSFIPLLQMLAMAIVIWTFARSRMRTSKALDLFFVGQGPWLLWLLIVAGSCLFVPMKQVYLWPTQPGWFLPLSLFITFVWSNVTSFAFLNAALKLNVVRAAVALLLYDILLWGIVLSYLFAIESLQLHRIRL